MIDLVLYHANCPDGFCAAWVLRTAFPEATFTPAYYGQRPPKVRGKHVLIVDFSYPRATLEAMRTEAASLQVLDHHKSAQAELEGLPYCVFDMDRSGARLAWDHLAILGLLPQKFHGWDTHLFELGEAHWLVDYVQDRDLWRWELPQSRAINAALSSYQRDFAVWSMLARRTPDDMIKEGEAIVRYQQTVIDTHVRNATLISLQGHTVPIVNATTLQSEIGNALCENKPFSVTWFDRQDGSRQFSLRSREDGVDVSEIAKIYGGGGHRNAAGFTIGPDVRDDQLLP